MRIWEIILSPLFSCFKQVFHPLSPVDCCDIELQWVFCNQKRNEFIKIIIWYHRKQEHTFFLILIFSDLNLITLTLFFVFAKIKIKLKMICVGDVNTFFKHIVIFAIKTIKEPCLKTFWDQFYEYEKFCPN